MNKLAEIKVSSQLKAIQESTESCLVYLRALEEVQEIQNDKDANGGLKAVIQHQKNMIRFFGTLQEQLKK